MDAFCFGIEFRCFANFVLEYMLEYISASIHLNLSMTRKFSVCGICQKLFHHCFAEELIKKSR